MVVAAIGVFIASCMLLPYIGQEFTPTADEGQFQVQVEAPTGSSIQQTSYIAKQVEDLVSTLPAVKDIYTTVGGQYEGQTTVAAVMVRMVEKEHREVSQVEVMAMSRERMTRFSHLRISVDAVNRMGGGGFRSAPIQYNLRGDDLEKLDETANQFVAELRSLASVKNTFGPVSIERQNRHRQITVLSNLGADKPLGEAVQDVERTATEIGMPAGVTAAFTGTADMMADCTRGFQVSTWPFRRMS